MVLKLTVTTFIAYSTAVFSPSANAQAIEADTSKNEVSVMAYNIENLFDTKQDNAYDTTYLPLDLKDTKEHYRACMKIDNDFYRDECLSLDWNEQILAKKIDRVVNVITSLDGGNGPDILILEEVENLEVLQSLMAAINKKIPAKKAYREAILLQGWDDRGIDIGMISRFSRAAEPKIYPITFKGEILNSRGILHSVFALPGGEKVNVFGVHFPSGGNPVEMREAAVVSLNAQLAKLPKDALAIAGGDFNINSTEDKILKLYSEKLGNSWLVSHLIGCQHCLGTEFFGKEQTWSFLDALLFSKNMSEQGTGKWQVDAKSIDVPNKGPEQTFKGRPSRFNEQYGVSDHWPVYARIRKN